jgi:hypothetical protein
LVELHQTLCKASPDLSAEALAGYAQYTISFEVFTPLLLSYVTTLLEILSLLAIRKTGEKHHNEIIVYSINVIFNQDSIGTA